MHRQWRVPVVCPLLWVARNFDVRAVPLHLLTYEQCGRRHTLAHDSGRGRRCGNDSDVLVHDNLPSCSGVLQPKALKLPPRHSVR